MTVPESRTAATTSACGASFVRTASWLIGMIGPVGAGICDGTPRSTFVLTISCALFGRRRKITVAPGSGREATG